MPSFDTVFHYNGWKSNQLRFNLGIRQEKISSSETKNFGPGILDLIALNGNNNPVIVDGSLTDVTGTPHIFAPNKTRTVKFLSAQDIWSINDDITLTAGIRYDNYSTAAHLEPHLTVNYMVRITLLRLAIRV